MGQGNITGRRKVDYRLTENGNMEHGGWRGLNRKGTGARGRPAAEGKD